MGKEQTCEAVIDGVRTEGRALLETDEILFRGEPRLKLPLANIKKVSVAGDALVLKHRGGEVAFDLGAKQAAAWAKRILEPPGVLDKLGIKEGAVMVALNIDGALLEEITARAAEVRRARKGSNADVVLFGAERTADLAKLSGLDRLIRPEGGIWVIYPKGRKEIREADVLAAGRAAGWKDNKVCRVSDTLTGLRFAIPRAAREPERPRGARK